MIVISKQTLRIPIEDVKDPHHLEALKEHVGSFKLDRLVQFNTDNKHVEYALGDPVDIPCKPIVDRFAQTMECFAAFVGYETKVQCRMENCNFDEVGYQVNAQKLTDGLYGLDTITGPDIVDVCSAISKAAKAAIGKN